MQEPKDNKPSSSVPTLRRPADISTLSMLDANKLVVYFTRQDQSHDALDVTNWVQNDRQNHPRLMQADPERDAHILTQLDEVAKRMNISPPPKVLICENGSFNGMAVQSLGAIVISEEANCLKVENLQGLLAHEIMHLRQDPAQIRQVEQLEKQYLNAHNNLRLRNRLGGQIDRILSDFEKEADRTAAQAVGKQEYVSFLARLAVISATARYNEEHPDSQVPLCDIMQDKVPQDKMRIISRIALDIMRQEEETHGSYNQRIKDVQALPPLPKKQEKQER